MYLCTASTVRCPLWCPVDRVPYEKMWSDDQYWLPGLLQGGKFDADFVFDDEDIPVTVSAGVAGIEEFVDRPATPDALIAGADYRLYLAKQAGRDCLVDVSGTLRI